VDLADKKFLFVSNSYFNVVLIYLVIWKEQVVLVVGAASSRDHLISRLEAAPTGVFLW
jgi:hypothetical protein